MFIITNMKQIRLEGCCLLWLLVAIISGVTHSSSESLSTLISMEQSSEEREELIDESI